MPNKARHQELDFRQVLLRVLNLVKKQQYNWMFLYSQQGAAFDASDFELSYVNLPLVFKYYLAGGLNLQVGPQFGILVDDNVKELYTEVVQAQSSDVSGIIGLGYDLPFGLRVDGRYNFGFTDVLKDLSGKNSVVTLAVGFSFL